MKVFQVTPSSNPVIAVTGPCYVNMVTLQPSASAEAWVQFRDTTDTTIKSDKSVKDVCEAAADKTMKFKYGGGNYGMYFSKGVSVMTKNTGRLWLGVTLIGGSVANPLT